jgi:phosphoesterase RecJ-like protein
MNDAIKTLQAAKTIVIIQAENPDGDSLASALALEETLGTQGHEPILYCAVDIPRYLRYLPGWDRVTNEVPKEFDATIIVDAATSPLLEKTYAVFGNRLGQRPSIVIDHHATDIDLRHDTIALTDKDAVATGQVVYELIKQAGWPLETNTANLLAASIMSDTLGLSTPNVTAASVHVLAELIEAGAKMHVTDEARRALNTKSFEIFQYKGRLFERVELQLDGRLSMILIPWEEIAEYSDQYNPSMLVIDEMRLIEGVQVAIAFKTYPDGKVTAKIRANSDAPIADKLAEHFGGGGHPYSAGFKRTDAPYETLRKEVMGVTSRLLEELP